MSSNIVVALQGVTTIAILVLGVYLVVGGAISPGALFATTMLTGRSLTPVVQLSSLLSKLHQAKSAYHAIRQLADVEQERPPEVEFLDCPARFEGMTLSGVGLTYRAGIPPALTNVSITIGRGEKVGIFGGIGSGKSTLLQLIMGLRTPSEGTITMAGRPIHQVDPIQYRRLFGAAFQDEAFFYGTIHENITFHRPRSSESEIVDAARQSGAMDWIKQVPAGFASIISEAGRSLSSGQRQTLVLARAFLGSPDVILLDEPTSNLDARSESELVRRLKQLPAETTLIAVSHRPAVFDACDRLIVLDGGNLLMDGEKAVVLARLKQAARSRRGAQEAVS